MGPNDGYAVGTFAQPQLDYELMRAGIRPNIGVGSLIALQPAAPGKPTWTVILKAWPPTIEAAEKGYEPLRGSKPVFHGDGGTVYRSPPTPVPPPPTARRTGGAKAP
jgi:hypothetical protein